MMPASPGLYADHRVVSTCACPNLQDLAVFESQRVGETSGAGDSSWAYGSVLHWFVLSGGSGATLDDRAIDRMLTAKYASRDAIVHISGLTAADTARILRALQSIAPPDACEVLHEEVLESYPSILKASCSYLAPTACFVRRRVRGPTAGTVPPSVQHCSVAWE